MDKKGVCIWGKKIKQAEVDRYNKLIDGATYTIRNGLSHMLMSVPNNVDVAGTSIKQGIDNGLKSQMWKIQSSGDGNYFLLPQNSNKNLALEVYNGSATNGTFLILNPSNATDKQKFMISGPGNGLFKITTKISNFASCADDEGLSVLEGANIFQWAYLGGLNQQWRFKKVDSLSLQASVYEISQPLSVRVYPNPTIDGKITVDLSSLREFENIDISIIDLKGVKVYDAIVNKPTLYKLDLQLPNGIYLIRIISNSQQYINKLIIQ
jgi:hypothetical protein